MRKTSAQLTSDSSMFVREKMGLSSSLTPALEMGRLSTVVGVVVRLDIEELASKLLDAILPHKLLGSTAAADAESTECSECCFFTSREMACFTALG